MEEILLRAGILQDIEPCAASALIGWLEPLNFPARHVVFGEGECGDRLYIIGSGKVKITSQQPDGRTYLHSLMGPADVFGALSVFDPGPRVSTATTVTRVDAVSMDRNALHTWITDRPEMGFQLLRVLARRLRCANGNLADVIFTDLPGRVAKQLLGLAGRFGVEEPEGIRLTHDLTQEELAQLVGATREAVNKVLAEFARRGWLRVEAKTVVICQPERLARRAK